MNGMEMQMFSADIFRIFRVYLEIVNVASFLLYGLDKQYARLHKWRVSERTLLTIAAAGGSLGALLGMQIFRHKTKKKKFQILIPLFLIVHVGMLVFIGQGFHF